MFGFMGVCEGDNCASSIDQMKMKNAYLCTNYEFCIINY